MKGIILHGIRKYTQPLFWKVYRWYFSKPRWYKYDGLSIRILPTVFHPGWFISTQVLLHFLLQKDLTNKRVLELGAGSGLIGLKAAESGARVTVTDINPHAIEAMKESSAKNKIPLILLESDLFKKIPLQGFDYIVINPPYFPRQPKDLWESAFFCGLNFEYFRSLFAQIHPFLGTGTKTYLILSEYCSIENIKEIAIINQLELELVFEKRKAGECQYIFEVLKFSN
jgi:release factor glutamine methyltransferase